MSAKDRPDDPPLAPVTLAGGSVLRVLLKRYSLFLLTLAASAQTLIVDGHTGGLLGAWHEGKWLDSAATAKFAKVGDRYRVSSSTEEIVADVAARPVEGPCGDSWEVPLQGLAPGAIAITGGGSLAAFKEVPPQTRIYQIAFRQLLDQHGIKSPVKIAQLWQADLDGNGTPEILASLYHAAQPGTTVNQPGDYSLIAVRFLDPATKRIRNVVPIMERYTKGGDDITQLSLGPLVDLNGDGKPELIVRGSYTKGKFTHVYTAQGGKYVRVLECTCGG